MILCVVLEVLFLLVSVMSLWVALSFELQARVFVFHKYPPLPLPLALRRPPPLLPPPRPPPQSLPVVCPPLVRHAHTIHLQTLHLPLQIDHDRKSLPLLRQSPPPSVLVFYLVSVSGLFVLQVERFQSVIPK